MQTVQDYNNYPMGPKLSSWLGLPEKELKEDEVEFSESLKSEFKDFLLRHMEDAEVGSQDQLVELLDELVSMDIPEAALKLADYNSQIWTRGDFRGAQAEGIAAMITGDLARAEMCFKCAHHASPDEPAPYTNLIQVLFHEDRLEDAKVWLDAGLNTNPNYYRLWELAFAIEQKKGLEQEQITAYVIEAAKTKNSWAGLSLASETDLTANSQTKAANLEPFYSSGERDLEFLIEYTGALGAAGDLEKIPHIYWEASKAAKGKELPWRLEMHTAQAYLALGKHESFIERAQKILKMDFIPSEVRSYLDQLLEEAQKELDEAKKSIN